MAATGYPVLAMIEREALRSSPAVIAAFLAAHLGEQLTALLAGSDEASMVAPWAAGEQDPPAAAAACLRCAYKAARLVVGAWGDVTARLTRGREHV